MRKKKSSTVIPLLILFVSLFVSLNMTRAFAPIKHTQFVDLAVSFLQGRLSLPDPLRYSSWQDSAYFEGHHYVYFGPIPALLLLPFVAFFGPDISQQLLTVPAGIANFFLLLILARTLGLTKGDAFWLALGVIFGSVYLFLSVVNISAYLVQIVGFTFLLASLVEFLRRRRLWLVGSLLALAGMTRHSLYFSFPFFLVESFRSRPAKNKAALVGLVLPVLISGGILGVYNAARFGSIVDTGYTYNTTRPPGVKEAAHYGLFSITHVPGNLYFLLFKGPEAVRVSEVSYVLRFPYLRASEWGMGLAFTSPFFLYLLLVRLKRRYILSSLLASATGILPSLLYSGIGIWQFGYRYALDIYPFLVILLASVFTSGVPRLAKLLIVYAIAFNLFMMGSIWNIYPFGIHW